MAPIITPDESGPAADGSMMQRAFQGFTFKS